MARRPPAKLVPPVAGMPVVVLHGPEGFLIEEYTRRLVADLEERHGTIEQATEPAREVGLQWPKEWPL